MPQYQGVWTLQQQMQALTSGQWATDPLFDYTTLLLQADNAANGAQNNTFLDSSTNAFAITRNGNTTQGSFTPFSLQPGAWGNYFGSGNSLSLASSTDFAYGTGALTIEFWEWSTTSPTSAVEVWISNGSNNLNIQRSSGGFYNVYDGTDRVSTTPVISNQWNHIAFVRQTGGQTNLYVNGISVLSWTSSVNYGNDTFVIAGSGSFPFPGYISNVRVVKGTAVYTASFTPSATPLTAITNTVLLTCQSNRFVDANTQTTAKTVTVGGTPSVQAFSPFAPQYQWTSDVIGGSGYFDGTGDYLSIANTSSLLPGTGDFTWEGWVYFTSTPNAAMLFGQGASGLDIYRGTNNKFVVDQANVANLLTSTSDVQLNTWTHLAVTRSGTTTRLFINGTLNTSGTSSANLTNSNPITMGASNGGTNSLYGYLSGVRFQKGTAQYTASFNIPTTPPTVVTNTQLLCNFTNAGIYDGTMKNNLETVADAKISTTVVKYGSGSMYFDGTGDYLVSYNNIALGTADCTAEAWVYKAAVGSGAYAVFCTGAGATTGNFRFGVNSNQIYLDIYGAAVFSGVGATIPDNTWTHIAVSRTGGVWRAFVNGVLTASTTTQGTASLTGTDWYVGVLGTAGGGNAWNGYIDDLRITRGVARYTASFTPPSVALPRQ